MTLSDLASIGSLVSGVAVLVSLIYLSQQTRQNTKHTKALIAQGRVASNLEAAIRSSDSEMISALISASGGTPTPDRIRVNQFVINCVMHLQNAEEVFFQHEQGLLSDDQFFSHRAYLAAFFSSDGVRWYWERWKSQRPHTQKRFKSWIDGIVSEVPGLAIDARTDSMIAQLGAVTNKIE